eukprot:TRINITY_DN6654_c0_g1_i1.p1 TRINITY_DN6654_c0_g1~~TRINITY_DN6654_c0_g1_i1.p1  ORF type:complete len:291 (+),score=33.60 TRINITY_DN6654_c0_g1_i1:753-1625(+)
MFGLPSRDQVICGRFRLLDTSDHKSHQIGPSVPDPLAHTALSDVEVHDVESERYSAALRLFQEGPSSSSNAQTPLIVSSVPDARMGESKIADKQTSNGGSEGSMSSNAFQDALAEPKKLAPSISSDQDSVLLKQRMLQSNPSSSLAGNSGGAEHAPVVVPDVKMARVRAALVGQNYSELASGLWPIVKDRIKRAGRAANARNKASQREFVAAIANFAETGEPLATGNIAATSTNGPQLASIAQEVFDQFVDEIYGLLVRPRNDSQPRIWSSKESVSSRPETKNKHAESRL